MSHVDIDDYECECSEELVNANLNIKTGTYTCLKCGREQ